MNVQFSGVAQQPMVQRQPVQFSGKKMDRVKEELKKSKEAVLSKKTVEEAGLASVTGIITGAILSWPLLSSAAIFAGTSMVFQALSPQGKQLVDKIRDRNKDESEPTNS